MIKQHSQTLNDVGLSISRLFPLARSSLLSRPISVRQPLLITQLRFLIVSLG